MSYAAELFFLLNIGLATIAWKINRAIARERSATPPARIKNGQGNYNRATFPVAEGKKEVFVLLFILICASASGAVQAIFTADQSAGCPPLLVNFNNQSSTNSSFVWDFGNGNTSTLKNPSATFLNPGSYQVKLVVTNGGQAASYIKTIVVFQPPQVNFTVNNTAVCLNDILNFKELVTPGDAPITSYAWGFGDGKASSFQNAVYQYGQPGSYDVTLVVQDSNSCTANKTIPAYIVVFPNPKAAFTASPQNSCSASQSVQFNNTSTGTNLKSVWNLNSNINSYLQNPVFTYTQESYNVVLVVTDSNGCKSSATEKVTDLDLIAGFRASNTSPCAGQNVQFTNTSNITGTSWFWDFGDGTISTQNNPVKAYANKGSYTVKFVIKAGTCTDSITYPNYIQVTTGFAVNTPTFSADSISSCAAPFKVQFSNITTGVTGSQYHYHWTFGNGDTSNLQNPTETFSNQGNYNISFTITDTNGCVITAQAGNFIKAHPPIPKALYDSATCPGAPVNFISQSQNATSVLWTFGDGDSSTSTHPTHIYATAGHYTITLTVFNSAGCDSTIVLNNVVHISSVSSDFGVRDSFSLCPPFVTVFSNLSPTAIKYLWDFGDGFSDTAANPTHIYFYPGVYTVKMIAYGHSGYCKNTIMRSNLITVQGPTGNFSLTPKTGCAPLNVIFSDSVSSNTKNIWCDLGDGNVIPAMPNFAHLYKVAKVYHPQFILTDYVGCSVSYPLDSILVHDNPVLYSKDSSVCKGTGLAICAGPATNRYQWSPSRYLQCDTCGTVTINAAESTSYSVVSTNESGCLNSAVYNVNIINPPVLNDSVQLSVCPNDSVRLFVGTAAKINWSPSLYLSDTTCANPLCTPQNEMVYNVTAQNSTGCISTAHVRININSRLSISLPDSLAVCPGKAVLLQPGLNAIDTAGVKYTWSPAQYLDDPNIATPTATINDTSVLFQVIVSQGHCAADTEKVTVYTNLPNIQVSQSITTPPGADVSLKASSSQTLSYSWSAFDPLSCNDCSTTNIHPTVSQIVYVEGKNITGCTVNDSIQITIDNSGVPTIFIPNAFTPNGDGNNDVFEVYGNLQNIVSLQVQIFNRWGEEVFGANSADFKWDGTYKGVIQPPAVYTYQIQLAFNDGSQEKLKKGSVTLLR